MVVGATTVNPESTSGVGISFSMHEGMGGPHRFVIDLKTNDPVEPIKKLTVKGQLRASEVGYV